jgi:hypothetical protein
MKFGEQLSAVSYQCHFSAIDVFGVQLSLD